jgi:NitT/TauT family transport system permease protein
VILAMTADAPSLLASAWNTLAMALMALALASVLAQALALLVALSPILERAVRPLAVVLQVTPIVAIAPLVLIWAGIDNPGRAIVGLAAVVAFFPIFSGAVTGLKSADPDLERLFDLYGASRLQRLTRLRLPSAIPFLLEGHKVAAGLAVIGAVVAEFVAGSGGAQGLAWRILEAGNRLQTARMFAALVVLGLLGAVLHALLDRAERAGLRWWRGR